MTYFKTILQYYTHNIGSLKNYKCDCINVLTNMVISWYKNYKSRSQNMIISG